jgi:hypothetical protein
MKRLALLLVLGALALGCGKAALGEECEEAGKTEDECESGGVCGKDTNGALVCLKVCAADTDCSADRACNGVEGTSTKGCRLKTK